MVPLVEAIATPMPLVLPTLRRGNCKKGAKCNLQHVELGDRQVVPSAPATSSSQMTGQAAVGPAIAEASGSGFVNSILRRAAPAFTPARNSGARGSASR